MRDSVVRLTFEGARRSDRQIDRVFCAGFFAVEIERKLDQFVEQLRIRKSRRFPELRIHADGRETWNGVELVDEDFVGAALEEKVAPRHPGSVNRPERTDSVLLKRDH